MQRWLMTGASALAGSVVLLVGAAGCGGTQTYEANETSNRTLDQAAGQAEVVVVAMHADWCPACHSLGPKVQEAKADLAGEPVRFVVADLTDRRNPAGAATLAGLGLSGLYEANGGKTGLVYVVDAQSGEVLRTLKGGSLTADSIERDVRASIKTARG